MTAVMSLGVAEEFYRMLRIQRKKSVGTSLHKKRGSSLLSSMRIERKMLLENMQK